MITIVKKITPFALAAHVGAALAVTHLDEDHLGLQPDLPAQSEPAIPEQLSQLGQKKNKKKTIDDWQNKEISALNNIAIMQRDQLTGPIAKAKLAKHDAEMAAWVSRVEAMESRVESMQVEAMESRVESKAMESRIEALQAQHNDEISDLKTQHNDEINALKTQHDEQQGEIEAMKTKDTALEEQVTALEENGTELEKKTKALAAKDAELEIKAVALQVHLATQTGVLKASIDSLDGTDNNELDALKIELDGKIDALQIDLDDKTEALQTALDGKVNKTSVEARAPSSADPDMGASADPE